MKKTLMMLTSLLIANCLWAASGDVLFSQNFNSATATAFATSTTRSWTTSNTLTNLVGTGANLFTSISAASQSNSGIAINSKTGGNSADASGILQVIKKGNSAYWSICRSSKLADTAPTALKISMKIWFNNTNAGSNYPGVQFAVGNGFVDGTLTADPQTSSKVHSGFCITDESTPKFAQYNNGSSKIYNTAIAESSWLTITWVINNTGNNLTYTGPDASSNSVDNDKFDLWLGTTKIVVAQSATTGTVDLQNIYIGNGGGKQHEFRLDDVVITDLTPAPTVACTVTFNAGSHGACGISSLTEASAGAGVTLPAVTPNSGYAFNGWYTAASEGKKAGDEGDTYHPAADIELFAQYSANTYTITLDDNGGTADGEATATYNSNKLTSISAPAWAGHSVVGYYKEAECTNLIADAEGNLQAGTAYTDGSGNWTSTSDQTLYAKWMASNDATFSDGAYLIGGSALDLSSLFANGNGEAVTYSVKNANGTGAAVAGSMFTATAAGTAIVTATQAASASVAGATLDAEITVSVNPLGNHVITYTLDVTASEDSKKTDINSSNVSSSLYLNTLVGITNNTGSAYTKGSKANLTVKIPTDASYDSNHYMSVGFSVSSGYKFIPTSVSIKAQPVSTDKTVKLVLTDGVNSVEKTQNSLVAGSITTVTMDNSERTMLSGTVTLKIYCYGATDTYRLGSPITISGIVVEETPVSVTLNGTVKYATYHNFSNAYVMPAGLEGIVVADNEGATLTLNTAYNAGDIVPAHEPLILHAADIDENTNFSLYLSYTASEPKTNMLKGLAANGTTTGEGKHYHLSYDTEDPAGTVGFYYGAADGNPFSLNADKAYLVIPAGSSAPSRFLLNEEENNATNVENIEANEKAVKFIENGRILIKKNGIVYDALGRIVK